MFIARATLLLLLMLMAQVSLARAESAVYVVGGEIINMPAPKGFCIADKTKTPEGDFVNFVTSLLAGAQSKLLMTAIECTRLQTMRQGVMGRVPNYTLFYTPFATESMNFPGDRATLRKGMCTEVRKQGSEALDSVKDIVAQKAKEMGQNFGINTMSYIGVIDEDDHGCYAAIVAKTKDHSGGSTIMSSVIVTTIVRSKVMAFAVYAEYTGPETTMTSLQLAKATAVELDALNR